jgi:hypothetical protein
VIRASAAEFADLVRSSLLADVVEGPVVVDIEGSVSAVPPPATPFVSIAVVHGARPAGSLGGFDVVLSDDEHSPGVDRLEGLLASIAANPQATLVAAQALRASVQLDVASGLVLESLAYSTLQAGPEFATWRAGHRPTRPSSSDSAVTMARDNGTLTITLDRPQLHNAFNRAMRDGLVEALELAAADSTVRRVVLTGAGPSFCSGGDLNEFGTAADPASAHVVRTSRSAAWWASVVGPRLRAEVHGACIGAGLELAAWADEVVASADAYFCLPEVGLGLIPGAGGTVSLPRRIGRERAAYLAISATRIDAVTAQRWGIVDQLVD